MYEIERACAEHAIESEPQHGVDQRGADHHGAETDAVEKHHAGGQHRHRTVDQGGDQTFRQQVADRLDRAEARHQVAHVPSLEERQWQLQQVAEQVAAKVECEPALQVDQHARSQQAGASVEQHRQPKARGQHTQQRAIVLDHRLVHRELHVERRRQHVGLQDQRQHQSLHQRRREPMHAADEVRQSLAHHVVAGPEIRGRRQLQRDAGEVLRHLGGGEAVRPTRRVMHFDAAVASHARQHDEVRHVPVQHRRQRQARETRRLEAQRPAGQAHALRGIDQPGKRGALERDLVLSAQRREVASLSVIRRDHREAGETAFRGFRLPDVRHRTAPGRASLDHGAGHDQPPRRLRTGSNTHASRGRRSNTMSAFKVMSGPSGKSRPNAGSVCRSSATSRDTTVRRSRSVQPAQRDAAGCATP